MELLEDGISLRPDTFAQVSQQGNERLRESMFLKALELRPPEDRLLELYCGSGNFTLPLARRVHSLTAVEREGEAIAALRRQLASQPLAQGRRVRLVAEDAAVAVHRWARAGEELRPGVARSAADGGSR